jgi:nicotinate-nucleotide adenylyltransferase
MAVQHALLFGKMDSVRVFPCWRHAFSKDVDLVPFKDRVEMARLAFVGDPRIVVDDLEIRLWTCHTIDLIKSVKETEPETDFVLIIGSDNLAVWQKWHRWQDIDRMVGKFIVPRQGSTDSPWAIPDINSTEIRKWISENEWEKVEKTVPPEVVAFIRNKGFWQGQLRKD